MTEPNEPTKPMGESEAKPTSEPLPPIDQVPHPDLPLVPAAPLAAAAGVGATRGRWLVALGVAGGAIAVAVIAAILLGARPTPEALSYIPGDAAVVAELRMDLPGDQLQKVGNLLAHFPGFQDQSTLTTKIDETLARLVGDASNGKIDYAKQVAPWLAGPLFVGGSATSGTALPGPSGTPSGNPMPETGSFVLVATTDGTVTCDQLFKDAKPTSQSYQGVTLVTAPDSPYACAIDKRFGLIGLEATVKAALDAHAAHTGMDTKATYRTARDTLGADRLATIYVSKAALDVAGALPSGLTGEVPMNALSRIPDWAMAGVRAEDGALVADIVTAPIPAAAAASGSPLPSLPPAHKSTIAPLLPADTAALVEVHGAGVALQTALAQLRNDPNLGAALGQVDSSLALLGGADQLVGWINDVGIVIEPDGTSIAGGVILTADGESTASAKADQIRGFLSLAALGGGADITEATIAGTKVTTVDLGNLGNLLKASGTGVSLPTDTHLVISFAAKGSALIVGGGEAFVRHILETTAGSSLADATGYKHGLTLASAENLGQVYVGTPSLLSLAETMIPTAEQAAFKSNFEPYLAPFEAIVVTTTTDHGSAHVRFVATVK